MKFHKSLSQQFSINSELRQSEELFAFKLRLFQFNFGLLVCQTFLEIEDLLLLKTTLSLQLINLTDHQTHAVISCKNTENFSQSSHDRQIKCICIFIPYLLVQQCSH